MRIAAITNSRIPSLTANSIQAMKVCQALADIGHEVQALAPRETAPVSSAELMAHYGLRRAPTVHWLSCYRLFRRLDFAVQAQNAAERFRADMLYTWLPQSAVLGLVRKYPVILEMHADVGGRFGRWWLRQFWRRAGRKKMTFTTRALRKALERSAGFGFPDEAVIVAPNGVDLERYADLPSAVEARRQLGLADRLTLGFTGHLYPGRGAELLFELARRMPEYDFLWVGGTPESVALWQQKLAEERMKNVTVAGFVENSRLPLYHAAADVLLMPYEESVQASSGQDIGEVINPMKMFEYMAAGRAIVSADLPVIHEVLNEENAVFCAPGNADAWQASLRIVLEDSRRREALGARARLDVRTYDWNAREKRILKAFEKAG